MKERADFRFYRKHVYRNFATLAPSQDLVDDLGLAAGDQQALKGLFYPADASRRLAPVERVLQKSGRQIVQEEIDARFKPENWYQSRYSDGTWPVLYTAEAEATALKEALFHMQRFYAEERVIRDMLVDRRVVKLLIQTRHCVDLTRCKGMMKAKLISTQASGYSYCQRLAKKYKTQGAEILRAPSARDRQGICVPIFKRETIKKDYGHLKYMKCLLSRDKTTVFVEGRRDYGG